MTMEPKATPKDWTIPRHNGTVTLLAAGRRYKVHFHAFWEDDIGIVSCEYDGDVPVSVLKDNDPELRRLVDKTLRARGRRDRRQNRGTAAVIALIMFMTQLIPASADTPPCGTCPQRVSMGPRFLHESGFLHGADKVCLLAGMYIPGGFDTADFRARFLRRFNAPPAVLEVALDQLQDPLLRRLVLAEIMGTDTTPRSVAISDLKSPSPARKDILRRIGVLSEQELTMTALLDVFMSLQGDTSLETNVLMRRMAAEYMEGEFIPFVHRVYRHFSDDDLRQYIAYLDGAYGKTVRIAARDMILTARDVRDSLVFSKSASGLLEQARLAASAGRASVPTAVAAYAEIRTRGQATRAILLEFAAYLEKVGLYELEADVLEELAK